MGRASRTTQWILLALAGSASYYLAAHGWNGGSSLAEPDGASETTRRSEPHDSSLQRLTPQQALSLALAASAASEPEATLNPPASRRVPDSQGNAFNPISWVRPPPPPPPPPVPQVVPPPPPTAPPLPYTFVGMLEQDVRGPKAFLARGDVLLVVSAGDSLDNNTYHVDEITAQQITITYVPMNTKQTVTVPGRTR